MKAYELLSEEARWTKRAYARNKFDMGVSPISLDAVCFCAFGGY